MSNQQHTGFPWSSPAGNTPTSGNPPITPAGGYINPASGTAYSHPGPRTSTYAPSPPRAAYASPPFGATYPPSPLGAAYTPAPPRAAYAPSPPRAAYAPPPLGATYPPPPPGAVYAPAPPRAAYAPSPPRAAYAPPSLGATYAPSPLGAAYAPPPHGTVHAPSPRAPAHTVHPANTPHAAPGYTYQHPLPQPPFTPAGGHLPSSMQNIPSLPPPRVAPPYPAHATAPPTPPLAPHPTRLPNQHHNSPPPPPSRPTTHTYRPGTIDLSADVPPPSPLSLRPVYQPPPYHTSIKDETGLFSKDIQRIVDWFVTDIGGQDLSRRFKGVVNHKTVTSLDTTNDPAIFAEPFRTGFAGRPSWTLPADQPGHGNQPSMPVKDEQTSVRVAVLLRLLPDHCLTKKAHEQNAVVSVPTIDISQVLRRAATLTATDLLRVFVQEITEPGQSKSTALAVRKQLHLFPGESWMPAAHRTLMHTRAANVQSYKPHAMEETYYWRCTTGDQPQDHCERVIGVLNPSDTNLFHPVLHDLRSAFRKNLNKQALNEGQLLTRQMIDRGIAAQAIYGDFL